MTPVIDSQMDSKKLLSRMTLLTAQIGEIESRPWSGPISEAVEDEDGR